MGDSGVPTVKSMLGFISVVGAAFGIAGYFIGQAIYEQPQRKQKAQVICSSDSITQVEEWEWNDGVLSVQVDGATVYPPCTCAFVVME